MYSSSCEEDYNHLNLKSPKDIYVASDARDFFLRNMSLIVVYKDSVNGRRAYLTKRLEGVCWEQLFSLAWLTTDQLRKQKTLKRLKEFVKPALSYATSRRDRNILKCLLTMLFRVSAISKNLDFIKGFCLKMRTGHYTRLKNLMKSKHSQKLHMKQ